MADKPSISLDALPLGDLMLWLQDNMLPDGNTFLLPGSVGQASIAPESWQPLTYGAGWANFGTGWAAGAVAIDSLGFAHIRGLCAKSTAWAFNEVIATLPANTKPATTEVFACFGSPGGTPSVVRIDVQSADGTLRPQAVVSGSATSMSYLSLSGITFKAGN